jgi:uncharacterized repeat protein (TIGR01451 family)
VTAAAWLLIAVPASAETATCQDLQDKLDDSQFAVVTLQPNADPEHPLCDDEYSITRSVVLEGAPGAGFEADNESLAYSLEVHPNEESVTVRNLLFRGSVDGHPDAGGILVQGSEGRFTVEGSTFTDIVYDDDAEISSGGALTVSGQVETVIRDNVFGTPGHGNASDEGGGAVHVDVVRGSSALLDGNTFTGNHSGLSGGGARVNATDAVIVDNVFADNEADLYGGGLALTTEAAQDRINDVGDGPGDDTEADADVARNTFSDNVAGIGGGGMLVGKDADALYDRSDDVPFGCGGQFCSSPRVRLDRNVYDLNEAGPARDELAFNEPTGGGAALVGVYAYSTAERYTRNRAASLRLSGKELAPDDGEGGGLAVVGAESVREAFLEAVNLAVAGNSVGDGGSGAGIYAGSDCNPKSSVNCATFLRLLHVTVAANEIEGSGEGAGIGADSNDIVQLENSIVFGNTNEEGTDEIDGMSSENLQVRYSDACKNPGKDDPGEPVDGEGNICVDPLLRGPSRAQGADVHQTQGSPTIDMAPAEPQERSIDTDYEDDPRPVTMSSRTATLFDMGADEYFPSEYGVAIADAPDPVTAGDLLTYTVTVDNAGPAPAKGLVLTISLPAAAQGLPAGCSGTTTVTCSIGDLGPGASTQRTLSIRPPSAGTVTATASVSGSTEDTTVDDHSASTTTTVNARPAGAAAPAAAILPAQAKPCVSRRSFRIRLRNLGKGDRIVSAVVRVNGKRVKVLRGRRLTAPVVLAGLPKGRFTVDIVAKTKKGKTLRGKRRYRTCTPRQPGGIPPL